MTNSKENSQGKLKCYIFTGITIFLLLIFSFSSCKVVKLTKKSSGSSNVMSSGISDFNEKAYIDKHWKSDILSTILNEALDLSDVLKMAVTDPVGAAKKYGYNRTEENANYNFIVKTKRKVISVVTDTRKRIVFLESGNKDQAISVQVGPVISGTAIRDSIKLIQYTDFRNQIEFSKVSKEIKSRVVSEVIGDIDIDSLPNKTISLYGCFELKNIEDFREIVITPVQFNIEGE